MKRTRVKKISREEWGARPARSRVRIKEPVAKTWIHHSASHFNRNPKWTERQFLFAAKSFMREIQRFHMDTNGWADIGYSFICFKPFARKLWVFEGRGWGVQGSHTQGHNSTSHGICVVGNFETERAGKQLIQGLRQLIDRGVENNHIKGPRNKQPTGGHGDAPGAATACPGKNLRSRIDDLRKAYP